MRIIKKITTLPENFHTFLEEILPEYTKLYGESAATHYAAIIESSLKQTLPHPDVYAYGMVEHGQVTGIMIGVLRAGEGHIVFVHVLEAHRSECMELELLQACFAALEKRAVTRFVSESIPFYSVDLGPAFESLGFECIQRAIMRCELSTLVNEPFDDTTRPMLSEDDDDVASVLLEAYRGHPDTKLHQELRYRDATLSLLRKYRAGEYGKTPPEWMRLIHHSDHCAGMILGHALSPEVGYIFQLAIHPDSQRQGLGIILLRSLLDEMASSGMKQVLLGVTVDSAAAMLYRRLGFTITHPVNAYVLERIE